MIKLAIAGACGRMGRRLGCLGFGDDSLDVVCALERAGHDDLGSDFGELLGHGRSGVTVSETLTDSPDVLIDFTVPQATAHWLKIARDHKIAMVIGTTGLTEQHLSLINVTADEIPIVQAPNMSVGVNLLFRLIGQIASALGSDYDIEIIEAHHRYKKDAPSGTALKLLDAICESLGKDVSKSAVFGRHSGDTARGSGEIAVHAVRLGDTVGEHTVCFGTTGETISISHRAHSRDTFAHGALRAAKWVAGRSPGRYSMQDVLLGDSSQE